jgi:hypothetical protein
LKFCSQKRGGIPKKVYLMDMNDLYIVAVRLPGWEFMAEASHINAKKAVRGLAADLQDFHEQGQRSSAAHLMQQGASAVALAAIEDARPTGEQEAERRLALKRKADDYRLQLAERRMDQAERQLTIKKERVTVEQQEWTIKKEKMSLNLELCERWIDRMQQVNPDWRADTRLQQQAQDLLCIALIEPCLAITAGPAQDAAPLAISDVVASLKHKVPRKLPPNFESEVGKIAKSLYVKQHGKEPGQHQVFVKGEMKPVYSYTEADRPLLQQAFWMVVRKQSPSLTPYLTRSKQVC